MPQTAVNNTDKSACAPKYIPLVTILDYHRRGLSQTEIARQLGCTRQSVNERFKREGLANNSLAHFVNNRAEFFALLQHRLLKSLTEAEIKGMAPDRRVWAAAVLYDKERLERGQSTENVEIHSVIRNLEAKLKVIDEDESMLSLELTRRRKRSTNHEDRNTIDTCSGESGQDE